MRSNLEIVRDSYAASARGELDKVLADVAPIAPGRKWRIPLMRGSTSARSRSNSREAGGQLLKDLPPGGVTLREAQRELIEKTLELCAGNRYQAARALGISRKSLDERMARFEMD